MFLLGLKKYGKGDWRNISRNFVITRTPTQVASHAQKYFIRQLSGGKDKRRASIHDITTVNLDENHISSTKYKTTTSPELCKFPNNDQSTAVDFNRTHGHFFISPKSGGNTFSNSGGFHESYGATRDMVFQMKPSYPQ